MSGAGEFFDLARDLQAASPKVARVLYDVFKESGEAFAEDWRSNAVQTAGAHAAQYPGFIDSETRVALGVHVETGPREEGQGLLGRVLEFGSATSPAHLDGQRALPAGLARLDRAADVAVAFTLPR